jgi:hypothetical protein
MFDCQTLAFRPSNEDVDRQGSTSQRTVTGGPNARLGSKLGATARVRHIQPVVRAEKELAVIGPRHGNSTPDVDGTFLSPAATEREQAVRCKADKSLAPRSS